MTKFDKVVKVIKDILVPLAVAALAASATYQTFVIPQKIEKVAIAAGSSVDNSTKELTVSIKQTLSSVNELVKDIKDSTDDNYYDIKAQVETTTVAMKSMSDAMDHINKTTIPKVDALLDSTDGLLKSAVALVDDMKEDLKGVPGDTAELQELLKKIGTLTVTLDSQIKESSPKINDTVVALTNDLNSFGKILDDKDIQNTLSGVSKLTNNAANITETIDISTRPLRKHASLFSKILSTIISNIKLTAPLF